MSCRPKLLALIMLVFFLALFQSAVQPCPAQTPAQPPAQGKDVPPETDEAKYDAPGNDSLGLFSSEWAFRLNATRRVVPEYPAEALRAGAQGAVVLSLYHDGDGNAANIKVVESPHPALTRAAVEAVERWKWRKFVSGGVARPVLGKLSFKFVIEGGAGRVENPPDDKEFRDLKEIHSLRLKAKWPDGSSRPANQGNSQ
jgi:TonB family protein